MAFMLIAVVIFFAMVTLVYLAISYSNLESRADQLRDEEARELVRQLAGSPEFTFTASTDCAACIDFDRAFQLSKIEQYKQRFWNLDYLMIEKIYPNNFADKKVPCTDANYPNCNQVIVIPGEEYSTKSTFVALASWDSGISAYRYEFGRIHASQKEPNE